MDFFWQITIVEFLLNVAIFAAAVIAYGPLWSLAQRLPAKPRKCQQVVDQLAHVLRALADHLQLALAFRRELRTEILDHGL